MILVTGAGGKTGRAVIKALAARGETVRALVRQAAQADEAIGIGAVEVLVGDMRKEDIMRAAMHGVRKVYHVCPNVHPDEVLIGTRVIEAARAAGVEQSVFHSVLHPQAEKMPHHWNKLRVEELLFESGLPFTILQPTAYMQNLLAGWEAITLQGVYSVPYPVETRLSLVDLNDVAEAAARVLSEPGHSGATYELAGTPPLTQVEVARLLSESLGRPVHARAISIDQWETKAHASSLSDYAIETLKAMFTYYERYGLVGSPNVLRWLLGREPATLAEFATRTAREGNR